MGGRGRSTSAAATATTAAVVLALALTGCSGPADPLGSPVSGSGDRDLRVLVAGDSISGGYFASTADHGYVSLLREVWEQDGRLELTTAAQAGARAWRVADLVADLPAPGAAEGYDVVVLEVGANDVGVSELAEWRRGFGDLVAAARERAGEDAVVVCLGPWSRPAPRFDAVVARVCDGPRDVVVALGPLFADRANRGPAGTSTWLGESDAFHPNDAGHAALAAAVLDALDGTGTGR